MGTNGCIDTAEGLISACLISGVFCLCHWQIVRVCTVPSCGLFSCRRNQKHISMEEDKILPKYFLWIGSGPGLWKPTCPNAGLCPLPCAPKTRTKKCPEAQLPYLADTAGTSCVMVVPYLTSLHLWSLRVALFPFFSPSTPVCQHHSCSLPSSPSGLQSA